LSFLVTLSMRSALLYFGLALAARWPPPCRERQTKPGAMNARTESASLRPKLSHWNGGAMLRR